MFEEKIKQFTYNQRTGANLTNIRLGAINSPDYNLVNSISKELENIGKKIDESRINRQMQDLYLEGKKMDLEFERTLADPQVFLDDELYNDRIKNLNELKSEKLKRVNENKYLTPDMKKNLVGKIEIENEKIFNSMNSKRTINLYRQEVSSINSSIDQLTAIGSEIPGTDIEGRKNIIDDITKNIKNLQELTGLTNDDGAMMLAQSIVNMEGTTLDNQIRDIINSEDSIQNKKNKINSLLDVVNDTNSLNKASEIYSKSLPFDLKNEEREKMTSFFRSQITETYRRTRERANRNLGVLEKEIALQEKQQKELDRRGLENAIYNNDAHKFIYYKSGKEIDPTTYDLLGNANNVMGEVTNLDIADFGNQDEVLAFPYITSAINSNINRQIENNKKNPEMSYRDIYQPVYAVADELASNVSQGNDTKKNAVRNAVIKDWALKNKMHPTILFEGEQNPEVFRVANIMTKGNAAINETDFDVSKLNLKTKFKEQFDSISLQFSSDKVLGDRLATQFILGTAIANESLDKLLENPELTLGKMLSRKQVPLYANDIKTATTFTSRAKNYHYIRLGTEYRKTDDINNNNVADKEQEMTFSF